MRAMANFAAALIFFLCFLHFRGTSSMMMMFTNSCKDTIYPAVVSKPDSPGIPKKLTGFVLQPGESKTVSTPANWTGTVWARNHCQTTKNFICESGDCGSNAMECPAALSTVPVATTLAEFTPKGAGEEIDYVVSVAKGFNMPLEVSPIGKNCRATGCAVDLNKECPSDVQVLGQKNEVIGCLSACEAFRESEGHYCGRPSTYSDHFKSFCPSAMTFEDDKTNTIFSCASANYYDVNFCATHGFPATPPPLKSSNGGTWPEVYYNNPPAGEEFNYNSGGKSSSRNSNIVYAIISITGTGILSLLVYAIWRYFHSGDLDCPSCNLNCICCNNEFCCNCCDQF